VQDVGPSKAGAHEPQIPGPGLIFPAGSRSLEDVARRDVSYLVDDDPRTPLCDPVIPLRQCLHNLWLLAIIGGVLAIICVSSSRFVISQPGSDW